MALVGIVNLAERLLNQTLSQGQETQASAKPAKAAGDNDQDKQVKTEDQFTPSAKNTPASTTAQEAGLFSVTQFTLFSAAADFLLAQTATPAATTAKLQTSNATAQTTAEANTNTSVPTTTQTAATTSPATTAAITTTNTTPSTQEQLQSLNASLAALGLSRADITVIDRVASLIKDFNPTAFTDLVHQLEALARAATQQTATTNNLNAAAVANNSATTGGNATTATSPVNTSNVNANAASSNGGFQVKELEIKFTGVQETLNAGQATAQGGGQANGDNSNVQISAFNLQIEEVNLTLTNNNGQALQVHAPNSAANANATPTAPQAKAAAA
jgi:hypothetical protein